MKKLLLTLATVAAAGFTFAQDAPPQPPADNGAPPQKPQGRRPPMGGPERQLMMIENSMKEILANYDKNGNGVLDPEEKAAADKELNQEELQRKLRWARNYKLFKAVDADGNGVLSPEEKEAAPEKVRASLRDMNRPVNFHGRPGMEGRPDRGGRPGRPGMDGRPGRPGKPGDKHQRGGNGNPPPPPPPPAGDNGNPPPAGDNGNPPPTED